MNIIINILREFVQIFKEVMDEKNRIERERLEFEKEKFKQLSQQPKEKQSKECDHEWKVVDDFMDSYCICKKCGERKY